MSFIKYSKVDIQVLNEEEIEKVKKEARVANKESQKQNFEGKEEEKSN